jgi:transcriptional regulator with XRE-family HTH domain
VGILIDGPGLRRLREDAGLGLRELAAQSGISASHLSLIETGQRRPSPRVAAAIAKVLDVSVSDLRY